MTSGGARVRSGPAPDPMALRRDRNDDAAWVTLPFEGFGGEIPVWPLVEQSNTEAELWSIMWRKPQAVMWSKLDMRFQIAAYVRTFLESAEPGAVNGLKTAALRMEAELGVSIVGMNGLRWRFSEDELAAKRDLVPVRSGAKSRLAALSEGA